MRFGIQKFLNPSSSSDSGYVKFSILPRSRRGDQKRWIVTGHSVTWQMADCSEKIYLDFGYGINLDGLEYRTPIEDAKRGLTEIKDRRKKMKVFLDAVNRAGQAYLSALDEDEAKINKYIDDKRAVDKERKNG